MALAGLFSRAGHKNPSFQSIFFFLIVVVVMVNVYFSKVLSFSSLILYSRSFQIVCEHISGSMVELGSITFLYPLVKS